MTRRDLAKSEPKGCRKDNLCDDCGSRAAGGSFLASIAGAFLSSESAAICLGKQKGTKQRPVRREYCITYSFFFLFSKWTISARLNFSSLKKKKIFFFDFIVT